LPVIIPARNESAGISFLLDSFIRHVITEINGWPYRSLTEDLEMTINCILHKWTSCFYEYAVAYSEEALTHKTSDMRRKRWCIG
jgi:cellulose synthase/poly-beta-1,6-N-acetylglucosamine synthase-like glycosyltransferase